MSTKTEHEICRAPPGKFQIVHIDPRDHWPTQEGAPKTLEEVQVSLNRMIWAHREVMQVFDDKGEPVSL